jgi:hypothetical protein
MEQLLYHKSPASLKQAARFTSKTAPRLTEIFSLTVEGCRLPFRAVEQPFQGSITNTLIISNLQFHPAGLEAGVHRS